MLTRSTIQITLCYNGILHLSHPHPIWANSIVIIIFLILHLLPFVFSLWFVRAAYVCVCVWTCMPFIFYSTVLFDFINCMCCVHFRAAEQKKWNANFGIFIHYCECTSWSWCEIDDYLNILMFYTFLFYRFQYILINTVWAAIFLSFVPFNHICFLCVGKFHYRENNIVLQFPSD